MQSFILIGLSFTQKEENVKTFDIFTKSALYFTQYNYNVQYTV